MKRWVQADGYAADLQAAYDHFKAGGSAAAERFFARYEESVATIVRFPGRCTIRTHSWRQMPIPRSPFSIYYGFRAGLWMLVGIQSTVQDPDRIQALLLIREVSLGPEEIN